MRPSERAANLRRARRRTLFAPTVGPRAELDPEADLDLDAEPGVAPVAAETALSPAEAGLLPVEPAPSADYDLDEFVIDEFVIDDDEYPEVSLAPRRAAPAASAPDRVDDIDDWLEEFAVSDGLDSMPH